MTELRWNPILNEWTIIAGHRGKRPQVHKKEKMMERSCPFCPGGEEIEGDWIVKYLPNKYPSLQMRAPDPDVEGTDLFPVMPAKGVCEVILYTKDHDTTLEQLPLDHITKIIELWTNRFEEIGNKNEIEYVFIFENTGTDIGVSLDHPHGQIYSFTFIPPRIQTELDSAKKYYEKHNNCLFCDIIKFEKEDKRRIIIENDDFICFIPFFAQYAYGTHIYPKRHLQCLLDLNKREVKNLALILKGILKKYRLRFPDKLDYIMAFHQRPTTGKNYHYFHYYIEFIVLQRGYGKKKYLGGVERGTGTIINASIPEKNAKELREIKIEF
ncbi:MAG: galactose-1-phosphate uridylyltransferase [Candidatus Helarchaeota archaeon]